MRPGISAHVIFHGIKGRHEKAFLWPLPGFSGATFAFVISGGKSNTDCKAKPTEDPKLL